MRKKLKNHYSLRYDQVKVQMRYFVVFETVPLAIVFVIDFFFGIRDMLSYKVDPAIIKIQNNIDMYVTLIYPLI